MHNLSDELLSQICIVRGQSLIQKLMETFIGGVYPVETVLLSGLERAGILSDDAALALIWQ